MTPDPEQRLSPLTIVTAPIRYLKSLVVPMGLALFAGSFNPWVLAVSGLALLGTMVIGYFSYRTVRYQIDPDRLEIRRGLINRSRRTIPLERIRGVDVSASVLHRLLGLAVVKIEAAAGGDKSAEGKLDAVTVAEAERLREALLGRSPEVAADATDDTSAPETIYFSMPRRWHLYAILSPAYLLAPFAALAAVIGGALGSIDDLGITIEAVATAIYERLVQDGVVPPALIIVTAALASITLIPVLAVAAHAIAYWRFTLRRRDDSLVTERGLLTRTRVALEHRRILGHERTDSPLMRIGKVTQLFAIVTGVEGGTRAALLPIGKRQRAHEVVDEALIAYRGPLTAHPVAARSRRLVRAVAPFFAASVVAVLLSSYWIAGALAAIAVVGIPLGLDRYRSLGHGDDGRQVSVRSGSLFRKQAVLQRSAIIGWRWSQTLFQRRAGLVTLEVAVGAGKGSYAAIDAGMTQALTFAEGITPAMIQPFLIRADAPAE